MWHKLRSLCVGFQHEFPAFLFIRPSGGLVNLSVVSACSSVTRPPLSSPCSALGFALGTSHPPALWPVAACVAGSPVRGRWGRLSRWFVVGAGDGSGHLGGPHAAGEMPRPCSSARKRRRVGLVGLDLLRPTWRSRACSSEPASPIWRFCSL